jgi:hypothetical protein
MKTATPFGPGAGSLKLDYAGGIGQSGGSSQVIPEATLEAGAGKGLEAIARFPLIRVTPTSNGPAVIGGGQLAAGVRYLLSGGARRSYGVALQAIVEAPTGDTRLVGDATQVMPAVLVDWRPAHRLALYTNLLFDRSIGGTSPPTGFFGYGNAAVWQATTHFIPAVEFAGSTSIISGRTQLAAQPELIVREGQRWDLKAGVTFGLNPQTPHLALRAQLEWFWGNRR